MCVCDPLLSFPHGPCAVFSPYEAGLAGGVLSHQQDHGLVVEVSILQGRGVELVELVALLQRQELGFVELLQALAHRLKHLGLLLPPVVCPKPAEHGCWCWSSEATDAGDGRLSTNRVFERLDVCLDSFFFTYKTKKSSNMFL